MHVWRCFHLIPTSYPSGISALSLIFTLTFYPEISSTKVIKIQTPNIWDHRLYISWGTYFFSTLIYTSDKLSVAFQSKDMAYLQSSTFLRTASIKFMQELQFQYLTNTHSSNYVLLSQPWSGYLQVLWFYMNLRISFYFDRDCIESEK